MPENQWTPPEAGEDAPEEVKKILKKVYSSCRDENPDETEVAKTKCAKIAWAAVKNAGWEKDADGKWSKKSASAEEKSFMETIIKGGELKNIKVKVLSLVDKAANLRELIWKSDKFGDKPNVNYYCEIKKVDDEKHLIYCPVYIPDEKDAQDDWATAETVEKAAHDFLAESKTYAIDTNHNMELVEDCSIVESAILKGTHEYLPDEKEGTWYVAMKIENDEVWKGVKDGVYKGVSLYGFANRIETPSDSPEGEEKKFFKMLKKFFTGEDESEQIVKDFNEALDKIEFTKLSDAFWSTIYAIFDDETIDDKKAAILESIDQMRAKVESMATAKSLINKAGKTISAANMIKLKSAMTSIQSILDAAEAATEKRKQFNLTREHAPLSEGVNNMETIEKSKYDADLKVKQDEIDELKKEVDELKKKSPGSKQIDGDAVAGAQDGKKKVYKGFGWLKDLSASGGVNSK